MDIQKPGSKGDPKKGKKPPVEKKWNNPKDPEGTEDKRDMEQVERQIEEAQRRKENLTDDENDNN